MIKHKFLILLLVTSMIMGQMEVRAAETEKGDVPATYGDADANGFDIQDGVLVGYTGTDTEVVIPENVTSIGEEAFARSNLTEVTIPEGVTDIGKMAFFDCKELVSVAIPASVANIDKYAFEGTEWLENKKQENPMVVVNHILLDGTTCTGATTLPENVTCIGDEAFARSGLTEVTIPKGVTRIKEGAFIFCSALKSITVEAGNKVYNSGDGCNAVIETQTKKLVVGCRNTTIAPDIKSIGDYAFMGCAVLKKVTIPASVDSIGDYAFNKCTNLVDITLENGVKSIGYASFANCIELREIALPASVTDIGDSAFNFCEFLEKVVLPEKLESIGKSAFEQCVNLKEITLPESVRNIGDYAFRECIITEMTLHGNMESVGERAFQNCSDLTKITIENGVKSIGEFAFLGCSGLKEITLPASVESIGEGLTYACSHLESIHVEAGNKTYSSGDGCNAIIETEAGKLLVGCKNTSIPLGIKSIANYAFASCDGLTEMTIPEGVEGIGERAFTECGSLAKVRIPDSVQSIGMEAFYKCKSLTKVRIPRKVTVIEKGTFDTCTALTEVNIPEGVTSIGYYAFRFCNGLTEVIIPGSAMNIGVSAFQACKGLTKVEIRDGVESIDNYAFNSCSTLTDIALPESVTSIGYQAFGNSGSPTVYGVEGSYAQSYAKRFEFPFKPISEWEDILGPIDIANCQIHLSQTAYTYDGTEKEPTVTVNDGEKVLVLGTDYIVTYTNNKEVGKAMVIITGIGDYIWTVTKNFEIQEVQLPTAKAIIDCEITISPLSYTYDGTEKEPVVTVKYEEKMLVPGTDYTVAYTNNKAVGTATVTITGTGDYTGTVTRTFEIKSGISTPTPKPEQSPTPISTSTPKPEQSPTPISTPTSVPTQTPGISRQIPKKGETVTDAKTKAAYVVTNVSGKNATVTYTSSTVKNARSIIVPAKVTVQGQEYKVTAIARDAFKNNKKLTGAVIGKNVASIGDRAFYRCMALKKITIPSKVAKIGKKAFYGCKKLKNIHVKTGKLTKKSVGSQAFKKIHGKAVVKVPKNKRSSYKKILKARGVSGKRKIK